MDTAPPSSRAPSAAPGATDAASKAQEFAHRVVEFAEPDACAKFFEEKQIDLDKPNASGSTVLMAVVARGRVDLIGMVMDRTTNVESVSIPNGTTVLHLAAMAANPKVIKELAATDARKAKLKAIANACNRNGDTPLMMASVVKNAVAAKILVEFLDAFTEAKNATGMTALMCASRLHDEREGPAMVAESAAIVSLLLAYGADVNAVESAGRQTALHFALLSKNIMVVEQLLTISDINLTARNSAGHSPLQLAKKLKLDGLIDAAVESQWQVVEEEARSLSEQVTIELENSVAVRDAVKRKKKDKHKKRNGAGKKDSTASTVSSTPVSTSDVEVEAISENDETPNHGSSDAKPQSTLQNGTVVITGGDAEDDAAGTADEWVTATKKKSKRKESIDQPREAKPAKAPASNKHTKPKQETASKSKPTPNGHAKPHAAAKTASAPTAKPQQPKASTPATAADPTAKPAATQSKPAPWAPATPSPSPMVKTHAVHTTPAAQAASAPGRPTDVHSSRGSGPTYDDMTAIFYRMFPIAEDLGIPVESFIAGAATRDAADLLSGLSISQVEMLQEAHLQAYHYLNERKIELARVLEAQRLEAQLELRRQLYQLP